MRKSTVTGGRATAKAMRELVPGLAVPLNEASRKAMKPLLVATKANAPVKFGVLRRSLAIKRDARSPKIRPVHLVGPRADYQENGRRAVSYAHIAEFGRAPNADGKGGFPGSRFATRAFESTAAIVLRTLELEIPAAIQRRVAKIAAKAKR